MPEDETLDDVTIPDENSEDQLSDDDLAEVVGGISIGEAAGQNEQPPSPNPPIGLGA